MFMKSVNKNRNDGHYIIYNISCGTLKTDGSFHNKHDIDHHNGDSPLDLELEVEYITAFRLKPMHLTLEQSRGFTNFLCQKIK